MRTSRMALLGVAALCLVLGPTRARCANVNFIDIGDSLTVQADANFECGVQITTSGETAQVDACWITSSPDGYAGSADAYMVEPAGTPLAGTSSDKIHIVFYVSGGLAQMAIQFRSVDDAIAVFPPPGFPVLVENGQLQLVNAYFFGQAGPLPPPANITIYVQSDSAPPIGVQAKTWGQLKTLYH